MQRPCTPQHLCCWAQGLAKPHRLEQLKQRQPTRRKVHAACAAMCKPRHARAVPLRVGELLVIPWSGDLFPAL